MTVECELFRTLKCHVRNCFKFKRQVIPLVCSLQGLKQDRITAGADSYFFAEYAFSGRDRFTVQFNKLN